MLPCRTQDTARHAGSRAAHMIPCGVQDPATSWHCASKYAWFYRFWGTSILLFLEYPCFYHFRSTVVGPFLKYPCFNRFCSTRGFTVFEVPWFYRLRRTLDFTVVEVPAVLPFLNAISWQASSWQARPQPLRGTALPARFRCTTPVRNPGAWI